MSDGEGATRPKRADHRSPSRAPRSRDFEETPFAIILKALLLRVPGAYASVLVDAEGETVDYAGVIDPFELRVAAAHARILLADIERLGVLGAPRWLTIRGERRTIVTHELSDGYALVVLLRRRAGFTASRRAFAACARALAVEAGWTPREQAPVWHPVLVKSDSRGRPARLGEARILLQVLGAIVGLPPRERGYRVRTTAGNELTLIREANNCWYADDLYGA